MKTSLLFGLGMLLIALCQPCATAQLLDPSGACVQWDKRVDPALGNAGVLPEQTPDDAEVVAAIDCLLKNQGNKNKARFGGTTNPRASQMLSGATVELASLYYISYLFTTNWQHGDGVALWNSNGVINPSGSVDTAYAAYGVWFAHVKSVGLNEARKQRLDPLSGTGLRWYGK